MFSHNLKTLRKQKGMSQEELAARLHVVRQTVSKWEKGLSMPDSALLLQIGEILEVSVATLLGENVPEDNGQNALAEQLSRISEELAVKNRRSKTIWRIVLWVLVGWLGLTLLLAALGAVNFTKLTTNTTIGTTNVEPFTP